MTILELIKADVPGVTTTYVDDDQILRVMNRGIQYIGNINGKSYGVIDATTQEIVYTQTEIQALIYWMNYDMCLRGASSGVNNASELSYKIDSLAVTKKDSSGTIAGKSIQCEQWLKWIDSLFEVEETSTELQEGGNIGNSIETYHLNTLN